MRTHMLFRGAHATRIWDLAILRSQAILQRDLALVLREEMRAVGGPIRTIAWPEPTLPFPLGAIGEAIVDYANMVREVPIDAVTPPRPGMAQLPGPVPQGGFLLVRTADYSTWRYFLDDELVYGLEWET